MRTLLFTISLCLLAAAAQAGDAQQAVQKAMDAGEFEKAVSIAGRELAKPGLTENDVVQLHGARSFAYFSLARHKEAVEDLDYVISHADPEGVADKPSFAIFYVLRGTSHAALKQYEAAVADDKQAIAYNPGDADFYASLGDAYYGWGKADEAIASYSEAIKRAPDNAGALANRGENYENKQDFEKAVADYTEAIRARPDYAMAYNDRATALSRLHREHEALADYDKAIALAPAEWSYLLNRAGLHNDLGEWQLAIDDLNKAAVLATDPGDRKMIDDTMKTAKDGLAKKTP